MKLTHLATVICALASLTIAASAAESAPLHGGDVARVAAFPDAGSRDIDAPDELGRTPLHVAVASARLKIVGQLIARGADVNARDQHGDTPLHIAARRAALPYVETLLAAGADASAANNAGLTPLHVLGSSARADGDALHALLTTVAARLVAAGADPAIIADGFPGIEPIETGGGTSTRDTWTDYAEIGPTLLGYEANYPTICQRYTLGQSYQGRELWAIKISDNVGTEEDEPEFAYISTMHGDEIVGVKMCMLLIEDMLTNYGTDPQITNLIDNVEIWIVPLMNPDGYDRVSRTRYNAQGYDLNRSFPDLGESNDPNGYPTEVAIMMNWHAGQAIVLAANFHGGALVVNYPFDSEQTGSRYSDYQNLMVDISEAYSIHNPPMWNSSTFYHGITNGADWYIIDGGMQDYSWYFHGCTEVTIELDNTKQPPASEIGQFWSDNRDAMLAYMEKCLIGVRGIVTDATTGDPLAATITVTDRYQNLRTDPDVGDYHRILLPGTYELHFEADGYDPYVASGVVVGAGAATQLDVALGLPPEVVSPNGGETLATGTPTTVTWTGSPTAQFHVQYTANYGDISGGTDGFERDSLGANYTTGGDRTWITTMSSSHAGLYSARAGEIDDSQESWMTRSASGGDVGFWYRVSSESGYDYFNFYVDDMREIHASGESGWTYYSTTLSPGTYELKWEYTKDVNTSNGSDTAWVDELEISSDNTTWTDIIALTGVGDTSTPWTPSTETSDCRVRVRANYGPGAYGVWDTSDADFTVAAAGQVGDLNCDGQINNADIDPFVLAITDPATYGTLYPECDINYGDCNDDGLVNNADIDSFVALLSS